MSTRRQITKAIHGLLPLIILLQTQTDLWAHDDTQTHARLSVGSLLFLDQTFPEDGALFRIADRDLIRWGSVNEDGTNYTDTVFKNHFFNPKTGKGFSVFALTAPDRASDLWPLAIQDYRSGQISIALEELGHVLHLLQDMTSPAHVHLDQHGQVFLGHCEGDGDDFEVWGYCDNIGTNAILQYISTTNIHDSTIRARLGTGLQKIYANQPQRASAVSGDVNTAYTYVRYLANQVYNFTTFEVKLRDTFNPNDRGEDSEFKRMFPTLEETTVPAAWWVTNIGYSQGQCEDAITPFNQSWWMMSCTFEGPCGPWFAPNSEYCVYGMAYVENTGGGSGATYDLPDNLYPTVYEKDWFKRRYGSYRNDGPGSNSMLRIYGDVLYSAAVAYGAGLLQAFLDEAIMPKPITDKATQLTGLGAQLNGRVRPKGEPASAWFQWGSDSTYGATTLPQNVGSGENFTAVSAQITGLSPDSTIHFRIVSSNRFGLRYGTNQVFRTPAIAVSANTPNAWQISDRSDTSFLHYFRNLSTPLQQAANNGWRYTIKSRMVDDGFGNTITMNFLYGLTATRRFLVWWDLDSSGNLTAQVEGQPVRVIATNGLGATLYHTHELTYTNGTATYRFDGAIIASGLAGVDAGTTPAGQIEWGSGSSAGQGQMNFSDVEFEVAGSGIIASYYAGAIGPAPNPTTQGWTANPASPALPNAFTPISPDFNAYLPLVETLPPSTVDFDSAQLNGRVDPSGYPAQGWFEWGEPPNHANATLPDSANGFGWQNINENLNGLGSGQTYQYRLVASNAFVVVYGADQTLIMPRTVVITASETPVPGQFQLQFTGTPGTTYETFRSTDLSTWVPIGEATETSAGFFEFVDTDTPSIGAFYRIRSSAP